jgi:hypothetical protein
MSGAALPDAQIREVVVAFKLLEARAGSLAGCQGTALTASPAWGAGVLDGTSGG